MNSDTITACLWIILFGALDAAFVYSLAEAGQYAIALLVAASSIIAIGAFGAVASYELARLSPMSALLRGRDQ